MPIKSRKDEIELNTATGKFEKTSVITSEMTAEELRAYYENLIRHEKVLEIELDSIRSELAQIERLLGVSE